MVEASEAPACELEAANVELVMVILSRFLSPLVCLKVFNGALVGLLVDDEFPAACDLFFGS